MRTGAVHYIVLYCAVAEWVRLAWADWSPLLPGQQPGKPGSKPHGDGPQSCSGSESDDGARREGGCMAS